MELADVGRALRAHKVLVTVLFLVTAAAAVATFTQARLSYQTKAAMVVLSPTKQVPTGSTSGSTPDRVINPFLNFGGSQETAAQVLTVRMSDDAVGLRLEEDGISGEWTFAVLGDSGSVIQVTATGPDAASSSESAEHILDSATEEFATLQREAGAPEDQLIRVAVVNTPSTPEPVYDTKIRMAVLVAALGCLLTLAIAMAIEGVRRGRRTRQSASLASDGEGDESAGADPRSAVDERSGRAPDDGSPGVDRTDDALVVNGSGGDHRAEDAVMEHDDDFLLDGLLDEDPLDEDPLDEDALDEDAARSISVRDLPRPVPSMFGRSTTHDLLRQR